MEGADPEVDPGVDGVENKGGAYEVVSKGLGGAGSGEGAEGGEEGGEGVESTSGPAPLTEEEKLANL